MWGSKRFPKRSGNQPLAPTHGKHSLVHKALVLKDAVQLPGCLGPLKLLPIQHLFLQLLNGL